MKLRFRCPDGLVHISIGRYRASAMVCETNSDSTRFKWHEKELEQVDVPATCFECVKGTK